MIFQSGSSKDGPYEFGYEQGWHWSKNGGSYDNSRDFFWIHWEINEAKPNRVKLHIECPNAMVEPELNEIKQEMAQAFLSPQFKNLIEQSGYTYIPGRQIRPEHIRRNKGTQPFRIELTEHQCQSSRQANIEMVNAVMGQAIGEIVKRFTSQLNRHFGL